MEAIGVDAGATWIKAGRFRLGKIGEGFSVLAEERVASRADEGVDAYFAGIADAARACGWRQETPIGLALPAVFTKDRTRIIHAIHVRGLEVGGTGIEVAQMQEKYFPSIKLNAENDAKCAAFAEWAFGAGNAHPSTYLLHLTWGTGIGTGLIADGRIAYGWEGGHIPVHWDHDPAREGTLSCSCGSSIDLEAHAAVPAMVERAYRLIGSAQYPTRLNEEHFRDRRNTSKVISHLAQQEDGLAQFVLRDALQWIARGLHVMAQLAYPDVVTIGGAMMSNDWLLEQLREQVAQAARALPASPLSPRTVHRAQLGNQAGALGAAALVGVG